MRLEALTKAGDIQAAVELLRHAHRTEDVEMVLTACEALLPAWGTEWLAHVPAVRGALRWAVDSLFIFEDALRRGWAKEQALATRIANLARLLPNPQPPDVRVNCEHCHKGATGWRGDDLLECKPCKGKGYTLTIAPTHALRLAIDALKIAKGEGWFDWWPESDNAWCKSHYGSGVRSITYLPQIYGEPKHLAAEVFEDGATRCGPICPPLPEVN